VNSIQMKSKKVSCILKNVMIQEFQHSAELESTQVMKMKMLPSQFESIAFVNRM
jgi:hypothetical protein